MKIYQLEMVPYFPVHGQKTRYGPSDWSLTGIYPITLLMVGLINISGMPYLCLARWVYQHPTLLASTRVKIGISPHNKIINYYVGDFCAMSNRHNFRKSTSSKWFPACLYRYWPLQAFT